MITTYLPAEGHLKAETLTAEAPISPAAVWIDLLHPTEAEEAAVEALTGIGIPTREEMVEIEQSSRLYIENGARYMTASLLCRAQENSTPEVTPVTFILAGTRLVTVRYAQPRAFQIVAAHFAKACPESLSGESILVEILEAVVDRAADMLEQIGLEVDGLSRRVFDKDARHSAEAGGPLGRAISRRSRDPNGSGRYRAILSDIGGKERLLSSTRESLASLQRLLSFIGGDTEALAVSRDSKTSIKSMSRDVSGLSDYAAFIIDKLQFLLDATIGMVSIEQNNIIKIFAVLSVVLMPPTLIASVYGMNFTDMPELHVSFGYPLALGGMIVSGILPYFFFKWRGWL